LKTDTNGHLLAMEAHRVKASQLKESIVQQRKELHKIQMSEVSCQKQLQDQSTTVTVRLSCDLMFYF